MCNGAENGWFQWMNEIKEGFPGERRKRGEGHEGKNNLVYLKGCEKADRPGAVDMF